MIQFNVHFTSKTNTRHVAVVTAKSGEAAMIEVKKTIPDVSYINKVKVKK